MAAVKKKFNSYEYTREMLKGFEDMAGVFTPYNKYWNWFCDRLVGPEGINWTDDDKNCCDNHS